MSNLEIKESAESTSRTLISVVYYVNLVLSIIALIAGVAIILDDELVGLYVIIASIVYIFWLILLKALFDTFVNISVKLDRGNDIIKELQKMVSLLEKMNKPSNVEIKPTPKEVENNVSIKKEEPKIDKDKEEKARAKVKTELDGKILSEIIAGNEMNARLMLMQQKGLSLSAAVAFIEETKNNLK